MVTIFIDMVEQGAKNPASVFGMPRELQFATLPDLFFSVNPRTSADVDAAVDPLEFNDMVKRVLKRKLYAFLKWKENTSTEIKQRRSFTLKYLTQHWEVIRMYMNWCRPYLRHIHRLTMDDIRGLVEACPEVIVAGTGMAGLMRPDSKLVKGLSDVGIEFLYARNKKALKLFNNLAPLRRIGACFHLTC